MKNNLYKYLIIFFFTIFIKSNVHSQDQFNFDVTEVEILEEGNIYIGSKKGIITTDNGVVIYADRFEYNKGLNILNAYGNVKLDDKNKKLILNTDKAVYFKNEEKIFTYGSSKAVDEKGIIITAEDFKYDKFKDIVNAYKNVKIDNLQNNYIIYAEEITYLRNKEKIFSTGNTKAIIKSQYIVDSKNVTFLIDKGDLSSKESTIINDQKSNFYYLEEFNYNINKEQLKGNDVLVVTNFGLPKSDQFYFSNTMINLKDNSFISGKTTIRGDKEMFSNQNQDPRIKGVSSVRKGNLTTIKKGVFTSCNDDEKCPPWHIKAEKIIHDKEKRQVIYDNAILKVYNIPVLYFPKFFHPDPTVKRRSGFLRPQFNNSNVLGSSLYVPYFHVISDSKDMTLRPRIYDNKIYMLQSEYRQQNKNSSFIADFGYTYGYKSELELDDKNSQIHFLSKFKKDLKLDGFETSELNVKLNKVNNDSYLKIFSKSLAEMEPELNPGNANSMSSSINLYLDTEKYNFDTGMNIYEKLTVHESSDRYEYVLPYYNFSRNFFFDRIPGSFNYTSDGENNLNNTNRLNSRVVNNLNYRSNDYYSKNGFVNNFKFYYKNFNKISKKDPKGKNSPEINFANIYEFASSWPLEKNGIRWNDRIIPKISYRINPNGMDDMSETSRRILMSNVFNIDRLSANDSFEEGQSLTLGTSYIKNSNISDMAFDYSLATVLRPKKSKRIPTSSTINEKKSNIFGQFKNTLSDKLSLNYNFSIDNNLDTLNYNEIATTLSLNNFVTTFNFTEENTDSTDINTVSSTTSYNLNEEHFFTFKTRKNRKINLTEYYDLVYEYKNDCLIAGVKFRKSYYTDRTIKPKEDLLLTLTIIPITTYEHRIDSLDSLRFNK
jgi:LPS-assembly protein